MLVWLLPVALVLWLLWRTLRRVRVARADPWLALQVWGARAGHPPAPGDTPIEYGAQLAAHAQTLHGRETGEVKQAAAATRALGVAVSAALYAPPDRRAGGARPLAHPTAVARFSPCAQATARLIRKFSP